MPFSVISCIFISYFKAFPSNYYVTILYVVVFSGIVSSVFAANGEGFFLNSPSEFVRFSLSARFIPEPACRLTVAPIVRVELATPVTDVPDDCVLVETPEPERQPSPMYVLIH